MQQGPRSLEFPRALGKGKAFVGLSRTWDRGWGSALLGIWWLCFCYVRISNNGLGGAEGSPSAWNLGPQEHRLITWLDASTMDRDQSEEDSE